MADVFHLGLTKDQLQGARIALLPGDPGRVPRIAEALPGERAELAWQREFHTWLVRGPGGTVLVTSTGIGGPSTAIAVEELARLGVDTFIRVGTTGAIQPYIAVGDVVITTGAVRLDGASTHYAPLAYPAVADHAVTHALIQSARAAGVPFHAGITASSDTFYPGQERYDTFSGYVIRRFQGSAEEWRRLHVLNYEMESATLFVVAAALGLRAGCVAGVLVNRTLAERVDERAARPAERNAIAVAVGAVARLLPEQAGS
jgi:uridine phosphorylase